MCVYVWASAVKRRRRGTGAPVTGIRNASQSRYIWSGGARDPSACAFDRNIRGFSPGERGAARRVGRGGTRPHGHRTRTHSLGRAKGDGGGGRHWCAGIAAPAKGVCARVTPLACAAAKTHTGGALSHHRHQDRNQSPSPWRRRRSVSAPCTHSTTATGTVKTNDDANSRRPPHPHPNPPHTSDDHRPLSRGLICRRACALQSNYRIYSRRHCLCARLLVRTAAAAAEFWAEGICF